MMGCGDGGRSKQAELLARTTASRIRGHNLATHEGGLHPDGIVQGAPEYAHEYFLEAESVDSSTLCRLIGVFIMEPTLFVPRDAPDRPIMAVRDDFSAGLISAGSHSGIRMFTEVVLHVGASIGTASRCKVPQGLPKTSPLITCT